MNKKEKNEIRYRYFCILSSIISSASMSAEDRRRIEYALLKLEDWLF